MNSLTTYEFLCQIEKQIRSISLGREHCLILDGKKLIFNIFNNIVEGNIYCLGDNTYGELGLENVKIAEDPVKLHYFDSVRNKIKKVVAGGRNTFVLLDSGEIYTFGDNSEGQSTGLCSRYVLPTKINFDFEETDKIINLETGDNHSIAQTASGKLYSWGCCGDDKLGTSENNQYSCFAKPIQKLVGKNVESFYLGKNVSLIICN